MVTLGEVATVNPRMPRDLDSERMAAFLPMAAVSEDGEIAYQEERRVADVRKGYTYFERGDVLLAKITPCFENGKATQTDKLNEPIGFGSTEFHIVRGSDELCPAYAFHMIWNVRFRREGERNMTGSAGQKRVPADFVKRTRIPLPPLAEQRRIAAVLDRADALRRRRREALALLDALPAALFAEMFGEGEQTEELLLSEICRPKQWKTIPASKLEPNGFPVYGANGRIGFYTEYNHEHETVLITCRGRRVERSTSANLGRTSLETQWRSIILTWML